MGVIATQIAKAYVQLVPSTQGFSESIKSSMSSEGSSAGGLFGSSLVTKLKGIVAAAGIGKLITDTLSAGGDLQQSYWGGLDTLYGEAADAARAYADEASKMGISMNDYAEQAVSFGAALKSAYGGDVTAAAEAANTAISDMADNSAKMGTDIESIQNAYQGFAKQNYTMLDNLKLGYGGTKTEMERLLADAEELSGVHYDIDNLGDVYSAIHVIQEDLDLTGVAAEEASTTFTGSLGAMKAAATNLMAELSTGGDVTGALSTLLESAGTFLFNNLVPMLTNILTAIPGMVQTLISEGVPTILSSLDGVVTSIWTYMQENTAPFIEQGMNMISSFIDGFFQGLPDAINRLVDMMSQLIDWWASNYDMIMEKGLEVLQKLMSGITENLPLVIEGIAQVVTKMISTIVEHFPDIIATAIQIIASLVVGLIKALPSLVTGVLKLVKAIIDEFKNTDWKQLGKDILEGIKNGILSAVSSVVEAAKSAASSIFNAVKDFFQIGSPSKLMNKEIGQWIPAGLAVGIEANMDEAVQAMDDLNNSTIGAMNTDVLKMNTSNASTSAQNASEETEQEDMNKVISNAIKEALSSGIEVNWNGRNLGRLVQTYA